MCMYVFMKWANGVSWTSTCHNQALARVLRLTIQTTPVPALKAHLRR